MKTAELKDLLKKCDSTKIEKIISLMYKSVPKNKKDELDNEIFALIDETKVKKITKKELNFSDFCQEVKEFIDNAYERNYFVPNRVISKKERPKWRFKVMNFIKTIKSIDVDDDNYDESNKLLMELFDVLSYACAIYLFNTNDPFASIGMNQVEVYDLLAGRMLAKDKSDETISKLLERATTCYLDRVSLHEYLLFSLVSYMDTREELLHLKDLAKQIYKDGGFPLSNFFAGDSYYYATRANNNLLFLVFYISLRLNEIDSEIDYFMDNYEKDKEVGLYILLSSIDDDNDESNKNWIKVYEYVVKKYKVKPRDYLKEEYKEKKEKIQN